MTSNPREIEEKELVMQPVLGLGPFHACKLQTFRVKWKQHKPAILINPVKLIKVGLGK